MNRRGFLGLLAGAIAAASQGLPSIAPAADTTKPNRRVVNARHVYQYDIIGPPGCGDGFLHRIDVKLPDGEQWCVDMWTEKQALDAERDLAPALTALNNKLAEFDYIVGEVRSYSMHEWLSNRAAQISWNA